MLIFLTTLLASLASIFRSRASLGLENLALRHQIGVLQRSAGKRPKLTSGDRLLWIYLSRLWRDWRSALAIVKPETVVALACAWRIVISPMIPQDFPSCYYSSMRNLAVLVIHLIATLARLLGPGGVRSLVAESLLLKHQLLIVNRSRQRSPNLSAGDRILAGLLALLVDGFRKQLCEEIMRPETKPFQCA